MVVELLRILKAGGAECGIENLAQDFAANLRFLIIHCLSIDVSANQENNVPVSLYLLELTQDISELLPDDTQFAYPLAKMQQFMLHHYANDRQKMGVYYRSVLEYCAILSNNYRR